MGLPIYKISELTSINELREVQFDSIPSSSGIYCFKSIDKSLVYIGKASDLRVRLMTHNRDGFKGIKGWGDCHGRDGKKVEFDTLSIRYISFEDKPIDKILLNELEKLMISLLGTTENISHNKD